MGLPIEKHGTGAPIHYESSPGAGPRVHPRTLARAARTEAAGRAAAEPRPFEDRVLVRGAADAAAAGTGADGQG